MLIILYWVIFFIVITCMINNFCSIMMRWYLFTFIVFVNCFIIYTNNWPLISFFFQSNECIKRTFGSNVDTRKIWIYHDIINVLCIQMIWFGNIDVWINRSKSFILRLVWNLPPLFPSWRRKHHDYLFYFCKIFPQYNHN